MYILTEDEILSGKVNDWFNCSGLVLPEADKNIEVFADVKVNKDTCGFLCAQDNVVTGKLTVQVQ
jgi:hypothetical protein